MAEQNLPRIQSIDGRGTWDQAASTIEVTGSSPKHVTLRSDPSANFPRTVRIVDASGNASRAPIAVDTGGDVLINGARTFIIDRDWSSYTFSLTADTADNGWVVTDQCCCVSTQTLAGSGAWNGSADVVFMGGNDDPNAPDRTLEIPNPSGDTLGKELKIVDTSGGAWGPITLVPTGTINGSSTLVLRSQDQARTFVLTYRGSGNWSAAPVTRDESDVYVEDYLPGAPSIMHALSAAMMANPDPGDGSMTRFIMPRGVFEVDVREGGAARKAAAIVFEPSDDGPPPPDVWLPGLRNNFILDGLNQCTLQWRNDNKSVFLFLALNPNVTQPGDIALENVIIRNMRIELLEIADDNFANLQLLAVSGGPGPTEGGLGQWGKNIRIEDNVLYSVEMTTPDQRPLLGVYGAGTSENVHIRRNHITRGQASFSGGGGYGVRDCSFTDNVVVEGNDYAVSMVASGNREFIGATFSKNLLIARNQFHQADGSGCIYVGDDGAMPRLVTLEGVTITDNVLVQYGVPTTTASSPIILRLADENSDILVTNNIMRNDMDGVVTGGAGDGIFVITDPDAPKMATVKRMTIANNILKNYGEFSLRMLGDGDYDQLKIIGNTFSAPCIVQPGKRCIITGNTFVDCKPRVLSLQLRCDVAGRTEGPVLIQGNIFHGTTPTGFNGAIDIGGVGNITQVQVVGNMLKDHVASVHTNGLSGTMSEFVFTGNHHSNTSGEMGAKAMAACIFQEANSTSIANQDRMSSVQSNDTQTYDPITVLYVTRRYDFSFSAPNKTAEIRGFAANLSGASFVFRHDGPAGTTNLITIKHLSGSATASLIRTPSQGDEIMYHGDEARFTYSRYDGVWRMEWISKSYVDLVQTEMANSAHAAKAFAHNIRSYNVNVDAFTLRLEGITEAPLDRDVPFYVTGSTGSLVLAHQSTNVIAATRRIVTTTGADQTFNPGDSGVLRYVSAQSRWYAKKS